MIDSIVTKEPDAKVRRMMFPALPRNATLRLDESALGDHIVMIEEKPVAAADRPEKRRPRLHLRRVAPESCLSIPIPPLPTKRSE